MEGYFWEKVNRKSTADSWNRRRDKQRVEGSLRIGEWGNGSTVFVDPMEPDITLARGYERIVYGDHGPYVEFTKAQVKWDAFPTTIRKHGYAYYDEHWTATRFVQAYEQKRHVRHKPNPPFENRWSAFNNRWDGYADYRPGFVYMSADALQVDSLRTGACRDDMKRCDAMRPPDIALQDVWSLQSNVGKMQEGNVPKPATSKAHICESKSEMNFRRANGSKLGPVVVPPRDLNSKERTLQGADVLKARSEVSTLTPALQAHTENGAAKMGEASSSSDSLSESGTEELVKQLKELLGTRSMPLTKLRLKYASVHGVFALDQALNRKEAGSSTKPSRGLADFLVDMPHNFAVREQKGILVAQATT
eukprot:gnl/MRDRNA2_/MRDRNA2_34321_c0_seq1.p1 gnl/MRDRNA2_/MRDRNA2_34321_c0~~gnl/MRDRNA2_/MRDRNA2_34321_c0_seq1.p1  ORF type:complete len:363 (+),score=46.69 gnl/MRDRNA2_/MRDRNA2_34321_c0_seq1:210-1298(+)